MNGGTPAQRMAYCFRVRVAFMIIRGLGRRQRPNPTALSASLASADGNRDRTDTQHDSYSKDHKQILLSASLGLPGGPTPGFPFEALVLHLETCPVPLYRKLRLLSG
jgi:hypothetical protein